jgi:hypothetical protein
MKKYFFIITVLAACTAVNAQEPADALRYSWFTPSGTARQLSVGGAGVALGGDISSTFINPAGLGFYKTGDFVVSPGFRSLSNKSTYFGRTEKDKDNGFSFGTSGLVIGTGQTNRNGKSRGTAFAIAVNRIASFNSNILYRGVNNQSSYSQKFLEEISRNNVRDANAVASNYPFGTSLAFNTYWIDTVGGGSSGNYSFQTRAPIATGLIQENKVESKGGITELSLALASNSNDKLFIGGSLSLDFLQYERESSFSEADATANPNNKFDFATFNESLTTKGTGVNLKIGVIYKPVEYVRLGFAFHSPTFYGLTDKYSESVITDTEGYQGRLNQQSDDFPAGADPKFEYWHVTPYRIMIGGSYVLREIEDVRKQKGFLTADIEYVNYAASSFSTDPEGDNTQSTKNYLKTVNKAIDDSYKGAFNIKVGGELKFTTLMVRLGAAYYGNPFKNIAGEKGHRFQVSGGLGYRNKGMFIDLAYVHTMGRDVNFAYRLQHSPYAGAAIKNTGGNAILTVGFKI